MAEQMSGATAHWYTSHIETRPDGREPRVYIASQVRLYRETLAASLAGHGGLRVAGYGSWPEALDQLAMLRPEVLLLDLTANNSLSVPRRAQMICPSIRVVAFAVANVDADVLACAEAGICGYVAQDGSVADVVETVQRAVSGELVCSPRVAALLFRRVATLAAGGGGQADALLTAREREIAALLANGLSNKLIARRLCLANATVKNHVHNILEKLKLKRRGEVGTQFAERPERQHPIGAGERVAP